MRCVLRLRSRGATHGNMHLSLTAKGGAGGPNQFVSGLRLVQNGLGQLLIHPDGQHPILPDAHHLIRIFQIGHGHRGHFPLQACRKSGPEPPVFPILRRGCGNTGGRHWLFLPSGSGCRSGRLRSWGLRSWGRTGRHIRNIEDILQLPGGLVKEGRLLGQRRTLLLPGGTLLRRFRWWWWWRWCSPPCQASGWG